MRTAQTVNRNRLKQTRWLIVLLFAVLLVGSNALRGYVATASAALQTLSARVLPGTFTVVNDSAGDQVDPHVDCDLVSYTNNDYFLGMSTINYFDFGTNTNLEVPGNGLDSLSDVDGQIIAFTEASRSGPLIGLFDTVTKTRTDVPGFENSHPALGGNLLAFENRSFSTKPNESEISIYDRSTGIVSRLTNDLLFDKNPRVSPTGEAIVWEKCQTNGFGCDIYAAIQTAPGVFTTTVLTGADGEDRQPRTNGDVVVYISNRTGENDIYVQPVKGGAETHVSIPGDQRDLNISGNLLSFESAPGGLGTEYDIYVYDLRTQNLYRVTNTPFDERLNSISVCNGTGRIVYGAPGSDFDLYSFTFRPPGGTEDEVDDLIDLIKSFDLPDGIENSLITKLQNVLDAIHAGDTAMACSSLESFINECEAQSGKSLTPDQASQLINAANAIKTDLGCP